MSRAPWERRKIGALASRLPYWHVLKVAVRHRSVPVTLMLLKDGTVVMGVRTAGLDIYTASDAQLNRQAEQLASAFGDLPHEAFVQTVFESGGNFSDLLARFASQTDDQAPALARRGRLEQRRFLEGDSSLTRCSITYWVGWSGLAKNLRKTSPRAKQILAKDAEFNATAIRQAANTLWVGVEKFKNDLETMGMSVRLLGERDMLDAAHHAVNPTATIDAGALGTRFIETTEDLNLYRQGAPLLMKGFSLASQLPLSSLKVDDTVLATCDPPLLMRALGVVRLAPTTNMQALHAAMYRKMPKRPFRLVVTHQKTDREISKEALVKQSRKIMSLGKLAATNAAASLALEENRELRDGLEIGSAQVFNSNITVLVTGRDHEELDGATRCVVEGMSEAGIALTVLQDGQLAGWQATLPGNGGARKHNLTLTQHNVAHLTPYWLPSLGDETPEILLNNRQRGLEGLSVRVGGGREDAGAIIVGAIGSGKTFIFINLLKYGILALGGHAVIIDKKGANNSSLKPLCDLLSGAYFSVDNRTGISFNPFPLRHELYQSDGEIDPDLSKPLETQLIMMAFGTLENDDDAIAKGKVAWELVKATYAATRDKLGPILEDAVRVLETHDFQNEKLQGLAKVMQERLQWGWLDDPRRSQLFNKPGHVDLSNRLTVYDFFGAEGDKQTEAVMMASLAARVALKMSKLPKNMPKLFAADEAWEALESSQEGRDTVHRLCRLQRSFGFVVMLLTQSYMDIDRNVRGHGILSTTSMVYLLRHLDGHDEVADKLGLNPQARHLFRNLEVRPGRFAEMLLVDKTYGKVRLARYCPNPFDLWWHTSRPADVSMREEWVKKANGDFEAAIVGLARSYPKGAPVVAHEGAT